MKKHKHNFKQTDVNFFYTRGGFECNMCGKSKICVTLNNYGIAFISIFSIGIYMLIIVVMGVIR